MNEQINRNETIQLLEDLKTVLTEQVQSAITKAQEIIRDNTEAQRKWIQCEERTPTEMTPVTVLRKTAINGEYRCETAIYRKRKWYPYSRYNLDMLKTGHVRKADKYTNEPNVVAWKQREISYQEEQ